MDTQCLASLPDEIILVIFNFIKKITDKRQFLKTCSKYNNLTKELFEISENNSKLNLYGKTISEYSMEKFTLELCCDGYFNMIPKKYFNERNGVIIGLLVIYGKLELLKFAINNGCRFDYDTCILAAENGHLDVIKWAFRCYKMGEKKWV